MSVPARWGPRKGDARWWETVRYALDSTARTVRLCLIVLVASLSPTAGMAVAVLMHHLLTMWLARH
jgi:hypothetical protein